ncbi:protein of unknown function [Chitinophaga jiangningensis]|uniref:DUF3857 domain-containing protein n=1 Tax=Chitinophaga jiangningensis TaxID=1419482 RepID=A0A1M7HJV7_9BACT|nr:DUF3857 domain-containing protein [Chitinophaga jiangningensis]SHM28728.1 protein of unknown function [Chitinophaga jiangningensis]
MRLFTLSLCCILLSALAVAQSRKVTEKYNARAEAARAEVWGWDIAAFNNPDLSKIDTKQSAVVLAKHIDVKLLSTKDVNTSLIKFYVKRDFYYGTTVREMVKINDKVALEEYSQISFNKFRTLNGFRAKATTIIGVRIIKPDGTIKEIQVDDELVTEEDADKKKKSKLAIPDLQVGDIIDYFVLVEEMKATGESIDKQMFVLGDDKPIKRYSVHTEISDKFAIRYTTANGAPDFAILKRPGETTFDLVVSDLPALPTQLWMSPYRQIPNIRMNINYGGYSYGFGLLVPPGGYSRNIKDGDVINSSEILAKEAYRYAGSRGPVEYVDAVRDMIKIYQRDNEKLNKDSIPYYVYYAMRYMVFYRVLPQSRINVGLARNMHESNNMLFISLLAFTLRELDIKSDVVLATNRYGPESGELLDATDFEFILKTRTAKPVYMSSAGVFSHCNNFSTDYEGQDAHVTDVVGGAQRKNDPPFASKVKIPYSKPEENIRQEQYAISLDNKMEQLLVDRTTTVKGALRTAAQRDLLLFEDYYESERKALGVRESFMEAFADSRKNKSLADEYTNAFAEARKEQQEAFDSDVKDQFETAPKAPVAFKVRNMALRHDQPDFIYDTKFSLEGFLKKAGSSYILDVGRLIGGQLTIKPEQRERKVDIYEPFARTYEYNIDISVPAGYKVEGVDKLSRKVDNDCGSFMVTGELTGDKLHLTVRKVYKHAFEKADSWKSMLQMIDAAADFTGQKVLFKKA